MNRVIKEKIIIVGTVFWDRRFKYTQRLEEIARATEVTDSTSESEDEEVAQFSERNDHPIAPPPPRFSSPIDNHSGNITPFLASNGNILPVDPYLTSIGTPDFEKELYNMKSFDCKQLTKYPVIQSVTQPVNQVVIHLRKTNFVPPGKMFAIEQRFNDKFDAKLLSLKSV